METEFKGFLAGVLKFVMSYMTDENIMKAFRWAVVYVIEREPDIEKRKEIIMLARDMNRRVGLFLESLPADELR